MNAILEQADLIFFGSEAALLFSIFAAVALLVGGLAAVPRAPRMEQRLGRTGDGRSAAVSLSYGDRSARSLLRRLERSLAPTNDRKRSAIRRRLVQAGFYGPYAVTIFYTVRVGLALALPLVTLLAVPMVVGSMSVLEMYLWSSAALGIGFLGPAVALALRISGRQTTVREGFPDTLDLMLVCVEAGLALNAALIRVAGELERTSPLLSEHFQLVALEMQAGASREAALRNLGERVGIEEVGALVSLLVQSETMGVSVVHTLRVYAAEMRRKRLLRAEEHANKLPVRMVLPMGCLIMPAFIIAIAVPAVIRIVQAFGQ
ncbi:MAG TPA: type II secretion system F family protein [Azospirillum sp.]|nr:type II secretion system F family protein [Azospirillum sp.]